MMETRWLPVKLTEDEKRAKGEELAKAIQKHTDLQDEKKKVTADFNGRIKSTEKEINLLAKVVESGTENRDVPVRKQIFQSKNLVKFFRNDTGECVDWRPLKESEKQRDFFENEEETEEAEAAGVSA